MDWVSSIPDLRLFRQQLRPLDLSPIPSRSLGHDNGIWSRGAATSPPRQHDDFKARQDERDGAPKMSVTSGREAAIPQPGKLIPLPEKLPSSIEARVGKVEFEKGMPTRKG